MTIQQTPKVDEKVLKATMEQSARNFNAAIRDFAEAAEAHYALQYESSTPSSRRLLIELEMRDRIGATMAALP